MNKPGQSAPAADHLKHARARVLSAASTTETARRAVTEGYPLQGLTPAFDALQDAYYSLQRAVIALARERGTA